MHSRKSNSTTDSSKTTSLPFSKALGSNSSTLGSVDNSHHLKNPQTNCNELLADSSDPRIKIFEPDTTLTASMPILTPAPVDQGIFIPEFECIEPNSLN